MVGKKKKKRKEMQPIFLRVPIFAAGGKSIGSHTHQSESGKELVTCKSYVKWEGNRLVLSVLRKKDVDKRMKKKKRILARIPRLFNLFLKLLGFELFLLFQGAEIRHSYSSRGEVLRQSS